MFVQKKYPHIKELIILLGAGAFVSASVVLPGLPIAVGAIIKAKRKHDWEQSQKAWKKFNFRLLKRNLKRLQQQKIVEIVEKDGQDIIKLTQKGRTKYLKFKLEELVLETRNWDGKWRLILYDVSKFKKIQQESFRRLLKQMRFLLLQKSVYLTPYKCEEEILYLKEFFNLGEEVLFLEVTKLENEKYYKEYFGL